MKPSIAFSSPDFAASMSSDGIFLLRKLAFLELLPLCGWLFGRPEPSGVLIFGAGTAIALCQFLGFSRT